jgi:hypothetical protein
MHPKEEIEWLFISTEKYILLLAFIYSLNKNLLSTCYVSGTTVLEARTIAMDKR